MPRRGPCAGFVAPKPGVPYPAFCAVCSYSRTAHDKWEEWTVDAERDREQEHRENEGR